MVAAKVAPAFRLEWWHYVALFFLLVQIAFAVVPRLWPGPLNPLFWYLGMDRLLWTGLVVLLLLAAVLWSAVYRPFWTSGRLFGFGLLAVLALMPLTYRVYPSPNAHRVSKVRFRVPLDGPVRVAWGGNTPNVNYHVAYPDQRWAYDLLVTDERGKTSRGDGTRLEDYYVYDQPVLAPAAGKVVKVLDGDPDMPIGELGGGSDPGGNQVVIEVAPDEFLYLCHLKPGSIRVKEGDVVAAGQEVARVGNSGNTSEPHLHVDLENDLRDGLPLYFYGYRSNGRF
ncbi:MAG TPA: M23 family metallopeptidase, partial [Planctomycetaceae bacterium]